MQLIYEIVWASVDSKCRSVDGLLSADSLVALVGEREHCLAIL